MLISMIAAMAHDRIIGYKDQLPWHCPADLKRFKQLTMGKPIIMGRKTHLSIGKPLPGRRNIVLSRQVDCPKTTGCDYFHDLQTALSSCDCDEVMIIGGASIYDQCLPLANRLYLTLIDTKVKGDTSFPQWQDNEWQVSHRSEHRDEKAHLNYTLLTLDRL